MSAKKKQGELKGQRPITSFLFKPQQKPPAGAAAAAAPKRVAGEAERESKRPRMEGATPPPSLPAAAPALPPASPPPPNSSAVGAAARPARWGAATPARPGGGGIPPRDPSRHARLQSKLVGALPRGRWRDEVEGGGGAAGGSGSAAGAATPMGKLTPLEQQVVELKKRHPDVLLIFEVGYKMRFFGDDAQAASRVLGIGCFPDHNFLTASVPVPRLAVHVRRLVEAGHRVGVVRQVETAAIKAAGANKSAPFERKLTGIYTKATLEAGELAGLGEGAESSQGPDSLWSSQRLSSYLVCVVEEPAGAGSSGGGRGAAAATAAAGGDAEEVAREGRGGVELGLVAVESSTGDVLYQQFRDSLMRPELESKLLFLAPAEILAAGPLSSPTRRLLASFAAPAGGGGARGRAGRSGSSAAGGGGPSAARMEVVDGAKYREGGALAAAVQFYGDGGSAQGSGSQAGAGAGTPSAAADGGASAVDSVLQLPPLVLRALAHALDYLKPLGVDGVLRLGAAFRQLSEVQELALSPNTLRQLEILSNAEDGGERGSLLWLLDQTLTPGGGRLMRRWAARPLRDRAAIEARLDAVQELLGQGPESPVLSCFPGVLSKLPDLERSCTRAFHGTASPSEFATMLRVLGSLHSALGLQADLSAAAAAEAEATAMEADDGAAEGPVGPDSSGGGDGLAEPQGWRRQPPVLIPGVESALLRQLLAAAGDLGVAAAAREWLGRIDEEAAAANDMLKLFRDEDPPPFPDVKRWRTNVAEAEAHLQGLLPGLARLLNVRSVSYISLQNQGDYLVEVPVDLVSRVPKDWEKVSSTKKFVRFHPPAVKAGIQRLQLAGEHLQAACAAAWKELLCSFGRQYLAFRGAVQALSALDCLNSLARLANNNGYCRPEILPDDQPPQLHIEGGRHPVLDVMMAGAFVPNDTHLQADGCSTLVVTGPNMGGKSVFIRQSALIAIMAQVGSYVPAARVRMHAMDAVFTRMGASDNIALGRSTFLEELGEASAILSRATPRSLVVVDELGRGTSTRDGVAIAAATLEYIAKDLGCLTLFVTHYPQVAALAQQLPDLVATGFMDFLEEANEADAAPAAAPAPTAAEEEVAAQAGPSNAEGATPAAAAAAEAVGGSGAAAEPALPKVTFLYKLTPGVAPRSFGLNVARMAHLPLSVVQRAAVLSAGLEAAERAREAARAAAAGDASTVAEAGDEPEALALGEGEAAEGAALQGAMERVLGEVRRLVAGGGEPSMEELRGLQELGRAAPSNGA